MKKSAGFTLFEMAIVLVIIALIIGSIFIGKSIIRSAKLREVIVEYDHYLKAFQEFQDKYHALPGDMKTATTLWGNFNSCPPGVITCTLNGDGSGTIGSSDGAWGTITPDTTSNEWCLAWQHLANAGLIEGQYTGYGCDSAPVGGTNVPASQFKPGIWRIFYHLQAATDTSLWADQYGHLLNFSSTTNVGPNGNTEFGGAVLSPNDTHDIDEKIDDGMPGTGKVRVLRDAIMPNCTTNDTGGTSNNNDQPLTTYNTSDDAYCAPFFILGF